MADKVAVRRETAELCLRVLLIDVRPALQSAAQAPVRTDYQREVVDASRGTLRGLDAMIADLKGALG